jgi:hypothetical protein
MPAETDPKKKGQKGSGLSGPRKRAAATAVALTNVDPETVDWASVAQLMSARVMGAIVTADMCRDRWANVILKLKPKSMPWTEEEDAVLMDEDKPRHIDGSTDWMAMQTALNRSVESCRVRYYNKLKAEKDKKKKKGPFTKTDDKIIIDTVNNWPEGKLGVWSMLGNMLGRSDVNVRSRWVQTLSRKAEASNVEKTTPGAGAGEEELSSEDEQEPTRPQVLKGSKITW